MTYREFVALIYDPNREFNYYFAAEETPEPLKEDIVAPHFATKHLRTTDKAFWHGFGTVSTAHTDGDENFMCIIKGYKNFTIASPFLTRDTYVGAFDIPNWELIPDNYSPVDFKNPDFEFYPAFKNVKVYTVHLKPGDCMFLPANWWHMVHSSPEECVAVS